MEDASTERIPQASQEARRWRVGLSELDGLWPSGGILGSLSRPQRWSVRV